MLLTSEDVSRCLRTMSPQDDVALDAFCELSGNATHWSRHNWLVEEDAFIDDAVARFGMQWRQIALEMRSTMRTSWYRSEDAIRNRWKRNHFRAMNDDSTIHDDTL